jgi:hypothetical protein
VEVFIGYPIAMTRAATPEKHAMAMTMTHSGLLMACGVATAPALGAVAASCVTRRRCTSNDPSGAGKEFLRTAVACDMALILFMRGTHIYRRVG